jgi:hypothetical protein
MLTKNVLTSEPNSGVLEEPFCTGGAPVHVNCAF